MLTGHNVECTAFKDHGVYTVFTGHYIACTRV